jgi:hypothetical protein
MLLRHEPRRGCFCLLAQADNQGGEKDSVQRRNERKDIKMSDFTCILFPRPSFVEGVARLVDVSGLLNQYNISASAEEADRKAIAADWNQVGLEIRKAANDEFRLVSKPQG